ncbi:MAG: hypothetical protein AAGK78_07010, partial [Planctomycetota bacterium]
GTTCLSAALLGRQYVGLELNPDYVELARTRIASALEKLDGIDTGTSIDLKAAIDKITDNDRASKVETATDALGRPRTPRRKKQSA